MIGSILLRGFALQAQDGLVLGQDFWACQHRRLLDLPPQLLENIVCRAGSAGAGAFASCRRLRDAFNRAVSTPDGAAQYLVSRHGPSAAVQVYAAKELLQQRLLREAPPAGHAAVLLATLQRIERLQPVGAVLPADVCRMFSAAAKLRHTEVLKYLADRLVTRPSEEAARMATRAMPLATSTEALRILYEAALQIIDAGSADTQRFLDAFLFQASAIGARELVTEALRDGARANANGSLALAAACVAGDAELVAALLAAGADPNAREGQPLCLAAANGHTDVVKLLLAAGADPRVRGSYVLFAAALSGAWDSLRAAMDAGADTLTSAGACAVYWAVYHGAVAEANLLLDTGVGLYDYLQTAASLAAERSYVGLVRRLVMLLMEMHGTICFCAASLGVLAVMRGQIEVIAELNSLVQQHGTFTDAVVVTVVVSAASILCDQPAILDEQLAAIRRCCGAGDSSRGAWKEFAVWVASGGLMVRYGVPLAALAALWRRRLPRWSLLRVVAWHCLPAAVGDLLQHGVIVLAVQCMLDC